MDKIQQIKSYLLAELALKLDRVKSTFDDVPIIMNKSNYPYCFFSLTDSSPAIHPQLIEDMADLIVYYGAFESADIVVSEADRGAGPLTHAVALRCNLPYILANWYPANILGEIVVKAHTGFAGSGSICLNGLSREQSVILVDDLLSTGGTANALLTAVKDAGARVIEAIFVAEKLGLGGRARILENHNIPIKSIVQFTASGRATKVV